MGVSNAIMFLICIAVLSTLRRIRTRFRLLETMLIYMVIVVAMEQVQSAVQDNFKLIQFPKSLPEFFFYKMYQLIVIPTATLWLLYSFFSPKIHFPLRALFAAIWFFGLSGAYLLFERLGILKLTGWHLGYSAAIWLFVLFESFCFALWFRQLLRKQGDCDAVPAGTIRHE